MTIQEPFHIWFERSGGFAGLSTSVEISSESLGGEEVEKLKKLIDQSGFYEFQTGDSAGGNMPDQFQYRITIESKGEKKMVELNETTMPETFRPLVDYLIQKARERR